MPDDQTVERVAEAIENADVDPWPDKKGAEPVAHYTKLARAAIAALGPQLTAEEAATLADFLKEKHPRVLFGTAAEAYIAKLTLIANGEKP